MAGFAFFAAGDGGGRRRRKKEAEEEEQDIREVRPHAGARAQRGTVPHSSLSFFPPPPSLPVRRQCCQIL